MRKSTYVMAFPVKGRYLLINGLSGAVRLISKEIAQKFFDGEVLEELKPFFTHLEPEEELKTAQSLCAFLMRNAAQCADGTLVVTYGCNLRCPYCYEIWVKGPETMKPVINEYRVDKAFEALESLNRNCSGKKLLTLTGGEPLMKKNEEIIKYILKKGENMGYTFIIFSNGVELHHFLPLLSTISVDYIQITLDGPRHLHDERRIFAHKKGTFDFIVENIEKARGVGLPLLIRTNTDSKILSHIYELAEFYRGRGWIDDPTMKFLLAHLCDQNVDIKGVDESLERYLEVMELLKRPELSFFSPYPFKKLHSLIDESPQFWPSFWNCNAVTRRYVFDPFGDVYPCRGMLGWKEQRIGVYIPELSFNKVHRMWQSRTLFSMDKCMKCDLALVCGGGCGYASLLNGSSLSDPLCSITAEVITSYLEYLYETKSKDIKDDERFLMGKSKNR
ncbi:MAG: radical SAM protein [Theionarchaea archaeon]|nr:radical SAM protein [Theionarchaea archaeon]